MALYEKQSAIVRWNGAHTKPFFIEKGVRQGCILYFGFEATPNRHDSFGSPQFIQITDYRRRVTFYSATIE